jgi:hypothetical protein
MTSSTSRSSLTERHRTTTHVRALVGAVAFSLVACGGGSPPDEALNAATPPSVRKAAPRPSGDTIVRWNANTITILSPTSSPDLTRGLAMTHLAVHDAVNAVRPRYVAYAYPASVDTGADPELAAAAAAHDVLVALRPAKQAELDSLLATDLAAVPSEHRRATSLAVGAGAAQAILGLRANDGSTAQVSYTPGTDPGDYQYTPPFTSVLAPQWQFVTPFALTSPGQFRPPGPTPLDSAQYAADYNEVKAYGAHDSAVRTVAQTEEAKFWLTNPPIISNRIARDLALAEGLDLWESARAFALLQMAFADALIATWDAKFQFDFWRPYTAIRAGDTDGNELTLADPGWLPLNTTPPFPEYPSAHAVIAAASGVILNDTFGASTSFEATSESLPGVTHTYASFDELTEMSTLSRIWGGFHFRTSCFDGKHQGELIGAYILDHDLPRLPD